jgi:hypothetical protein
VRWITRFDIRLPRGFDPVVGLLMDGDAAGAQADGDRQRGCPGSPSSADLHAAEKQPTG